MQETPPENPVFDKLNRNILASNPRVTKFKINWDPTNSTNQVSFKSYLRKFRKSGIRFNDFFFCLFAAKYKSRRRRRSTWTKHCRYGRWQQQRFRLKFWRKQTTKASYRYIFKRFLPSNWKKFHEINAFLYFRRS